MPNLWSDKGSPISRSGRIARPKWLNRRLLIGVFLIALAVVGGNLVFMRAAATNQYLVANATITPGQVITPELLSVAAVKLGDAAPNYISSAEGIKSGTVARTTIESGTLVARTQVSTKADNETRVISLALDTPVPSTVVAGSFADIWITQNQSALNFGNKVATADASQSSDPASGAQPAATTAPDSAAPAAGPAAPAAGPAAPAAGAAATPAAPSAAPEPATAPAAAKAPATSSAPAAQPSASAQPTSKGNDGENHAADPAVSAATQRIPVTVVSITKSQGLMAGSQILEVTCRVEDVPQLISAMSADADFTIVAQTTGK